MKRTRYVALALAAWIGAGCAENITDVESPEPVDSRTLATGVTAKLFMAPAEIRARETVGVVLHIESTRTTAMQIAYDDPIATIHTTLGGQEVTLVGGQNPAPGAQASITLDPGTSQTFRWQLTGERPGGTAATLGTYQLALRLRLRSVDGAAVATPVELRGSFTLR